MIFRQLEYLDARDREQHFDRAALACHVSQPALSAAIRKLDRAAKMGSKSHDEMANATSSGWDRPGR